MNRCLLRYMARLCIKYKTRISILRTHLTTKRITECIFCQELYTYDTETRWCMDNRVTKKATRISQGKCTQCEYMILEMQPGGYNVYNYTFGKTELSFGLNLSKLDEYLKYYQILDQLLPQSDDLCHLICSYIVINEQYPTRSLTEYIKWIFLL
jgi:hypothetical protein